MAIKTQQENLAVTAGKHREKGGSSPDCVPDKVVVENNSLSGDSARATAKQAAESLKDKVREKLG
ncbi:hypothetical protein PagCFBP13516_23845, partial [Pantoea agglomerans]